VRIAAVLAWVTGLGFGLPGIYAIRHFAASGEVAYVAGFPAYGLGPFEDVGIPTSVPLLGGFLLVCGAEVVAGGLLWRGRPAGTRLAWILLPVEFVFWIGFALPFGPVLGVARNVMIAGAGWSERRRRP
jgi:hypothetical protein